MWGMVFVQGLHLSPLVFLLMAAAFRSMDPSLEESALMSGARLATVLRRVTLPVVKPALFASLLLMIVHGLDAFEVPALLGIPDGTWTFTSRIWRSLNRFPREFGPAGAYSIALILLASGGVYLHSRFSERGKAFQTVTGKGFRPRVMELAGWRLPATAFMFVYLLLAVVLPLMMLAYASTRPYFDAVSLEGLASMSLDNYRAVFDQDQTVRAFRNSFVLGVGSATSVMLMMAVASWLVVRTKMKGRWLIDDVAFLPLVIPGLVLGVSLLFVYLRHPLPIYGTLWILFIAYLTKYMPYGMRFANASMYQISGELEESAQMSGATWAQIFRRVILPLLVPGFVAGWIYILIVSVRELSSSILIYSPGNEVLSIRIWELWQDGSATELAALGMLMVGGLVILVSVAYKVGTFFGIRGGLAPSATAVEGPAQRHA
jgi:iron(III) transport system permease protein